MGTMVFEPNCKLGLVIYIKMDQSGTVAGTFSVKVGVPFVSPEPNFHFLCRLGLPSLQTAYVSKVCPLPHLKLVLLLTLDWGGGFLLTTPCSFLYWKTIKYFTFAPALSTLPFAKPVLELTPHPRESRSSCV